MVLFQKYEKREPFLQFDGVLKPGIHGETDRERETFFSFPVPQADILVSIYEI
jgi:hypothetical protein